MRMLFLLLLVSSLFGQIAQAAISEGEYTELIALFQKHYPDIQIQGSWDNDTVNAQAMRFDDSKLIVIYGGLARERTTTLDSFTLVVCHEVGHHLGDKPYFPSMAGVPWASGEGAADYYSIQSCFNKLAPAVGEQAVTLPAVYENDLRQICSGQSNTAICRRSLIAGLIIAKLQWQVLPNESNEPSLQRKDDSIVKSTLLDYGSPQCRLDTFIASATSTSRPRCWSP
ncbi:hypothetical protein ACLVWU_04960 [Bdellovibrio sp. HCB290]|uniref:hypothetical protein n=1 Tax=Bdellovibrio sp. HCB290 TaxID=3394356 RepID=UPI0039B6013C